MNRTCPNSSSEAEEDSEVMNIFPEENTADYPEKVNSGNEFG
jgi:hypothetical protein